MGLCTGSAEPKCAAVVLIIAEQKGFICSSFSVKKLWLPINHFPYPQYASARSGGTDRRQANLTANCFFI